MSKYIYAVQYGACWRFTKRQWLALCATAAQGNGYNLDEAGGRRLAKLPPFWRERNDVVQPLGWDADDFAFFIAEIEEH